MKTRWNVRLFLYTLSVFSLLGNSFAGAADAPLPPEAKTVWDLTKAYRQTTPTREYVSINGLWRWQPANADDDEVPNDGWGWFKVPGCWPGITDYMQKDCQTVYRHPRWKDVDLAEVRAAWYQREMTIPEGWESRSIALKVDYLNSYAVVYLDGKLAGEMRFPTGELDLTSLCRPGTEHTLSLLVVAMPLKGVMLSFNDSNSARQVKGSVNRRGLCGDVSLVAAPLGERVEQVKVDTSVREGKITFGGTLSSLQSGRKYTLRARVTENGEAVREFTSRLFEAEDVKDSEMVFSAPWRPEKLWDIHTPQNQYDASLALVDDGGRILDESLPIRFGFREFWIDGRDFYLNGTRVFLCAVPLDNAQVGAAWASCDGARRSMERLKSFGINAVYTHNYGCEPGSHLSFAEILAAADDVGMLVSLSQPHFSQYDWTAANADETNGYAQHAKFYVQAAGNHPSVVMYSMSHNATGYSEDMNPELIDGIHDARDEWSRRNAQRALRAQQIVRKLDPSRVVYHHSSGNLGSMHTSNFYPNWVPIQEMSDWFEHWATEGVKPFFTCEYGAPFMWDWAMYRGWYEGKRAFGSADVPWDFCLAEWNAQFLGDTAYQISEEEKANLRWEARQFRAGRLWHRWDYPHPLGSRDFDERYPILAAYLTDNWRAFRTWGVSAISPWEYAVYWKLRDGMERNRRVALPTDWENLQRPGFSPDYLEDRYERMDLAYERGDWVATPAAEAMLRNNLPVLACIGGKSGCFTSKDHNFLPGETLEKQIVVINNSREEAAANCAWALNLPTPATGSEHVTVATGDQVRIRVRIPLPAELEPGTYSLHATIQFSSGPTQEDEFAVQVLPPQRATSDDRRNRSGQGPRIALFDPKGETRRLLSGMNIPYETVGVDADFSRYDVLIVGKAALTPEGPAPNIAHVRQGLKVLVFEQTAAALEKRLGFRVQEYGLRNVFRRVPDHPCLAGLDEPHLRDWRGEATLLPPALEYEKSDKYAGAPVVRWCGIEVPHLWRCGSRGNVASVLIEKPAVGDFLPIVDGGFSLQYSPLLEYREGQGRVLFCQMDVTGRTEADPAAERLVRNILAYALAAPRPLPPSRAVRYAGDPLGRRYLETAGLSLRDYGGGELSSREVLVVGRGGGKVLTPHKPAIAKWLKSGGHLLALELDADEANAFLTTPIQTTPREHIAAFFTPPDRDSPFAGVGPADVHNRDPRVLPLVSGGAHPIANGVLAHLPDSNVVFCQLAPYRFAKSPKDASSSQGQQQNLRKTYRRTAFLLTRLLANMGVRGKTPLLERFSTPISDEARPSIIKNGDFRLDGDRDGNPDHWEFSSEMKQATCRLERVRPGSEERCLRISCPGSTQDKKTNVMLSQQDVPVDKGEWYLISLRAKSKGLDGERITLALQDKSTWRSLFEYQRFTPGEDWTDFTFRVQAGATAESNTRFQIWYGESGTVWLSDIRMTPCDPPSEGRWTDGLYVDRPQAWDDPYRFFRW